MKAFFKELGIILRTIKDMYVDTNKYALRKNFLAAHGYEVIDGYFSEALCNRLVVLADTKLRGESYLIQGNCYVVSRKELRETDQEVQQIMNLHEIDTEMSELFHSGRIEKLFEERTGLKFHLKSITLQVDDLDTKSKRGFHNDTLSPPSYKAFIYLSDVDEYGDGPYTIVPGSHRHFWRRTANYLYNKILPLTRTPLKMPATEMGLFYRDTQALSFFGKKGTLILSNQCLVHKGWHQQDKRRRYMIVCYLGVGDKTVATFNLGREHITNKSMAKNSR